MSKKLIALFLILVLVAIAACTAPSDNTGSSTTPSVSDDVAVGEGIEGVTSIEDDLDTSALDTLDQDLADITW